MTELSPSSKSSTSPATINKAKKYWRLLRILFVTMFFLPILISTLLVGTKYGQLQLAEGIRTLLSAKGMELRLTGFAIQFPLDVRLDHLSISDVKGVWLEADNLIFRASLSKLLQAEMVIYRLSAKKVTLVRPPHTAVESVSNAQYVSNSDQIDTVDLSSLQTFFWDRAEIEQFIIGEPFFGRKGQWHVKGKASNQGGDFDGSIEGLGYHSTKERFFVRFHSDGKNLDLHVEIDETNGPLANYLELSAPGQLRARLSGNAPIQKWQGILELRLSGLGDLRGNIFAENAKLSLSALWTLSQDVEWSILTLFKSRTPAQLDLLWQGGATLQINKFDLTSKTASLKGAGTIDMERGDLAITGHAQLSDLSQLENLGTLKLSGVGELPFQVSGTWDKTVIDIKPNFSGFNIDGHTLSQFAGSVNLLIDERGWRTIAEGSADGLKFPGDWQPPSSPLKWTLELDRAAQTGFVIKGAMVHPHLRINVSGSGEQDDKPGRGEVVILSSDLTPWNSPMGWSIKGNTEAHLKWTSISGLSENGFDANLVVDLQQFELGQPDGSFLLGPHPQLTAMLSFRKESGWKIQKGVLSGKYLTATGEMKGRDGQLQGRVTVDVADLAPLSPLFNKQLLGAGKVSFAVNGSNTAPKILLTGQVNGPIWAESGLSHLEWGSTVEQNGANLKGDLKVFASHKFEGNMPMILTTPWQKSGSDLNLSKLVMNTPVGPVHGNLHLDVESLQAEGMFKGRNLQMEGLSPWLKYWFEKSADQGMETLLSSLAGSGDIDLNLNHNDNVQKAQMNILMKGIKSSSAAIGKLKIDSNIQFVENLMNWQAQFDLDEGYTGGDLATMHVEAGRLIATGKDGKISANLQLSGEAFGPLSISAKVFAEQKDEIWNVVMEQLEGEWQKHPLRLKQPSTLSFSSHNLGLTATYLSWGKATLVAETNLSKENSQLSAILNLPLIQLPVSNMPATGLLQVGVELYGPGDNMDGKVTANLAGLKWQSVKDAPSTDLSLSGHLKKGDFQANGILSGMGKKPLNFALNLPTSLDLNGTPDFKIDLTKLKGQLIGVVELERLNQSIGLEEHRLAGQLNLNLTVTNPVEKDNIHGLLALDGGVYENGMFGTLLKDISARLVAQPGHFPRLNLTATDGEKGKLSMNLVRDTSLGWNGLSGTIKVSDLTIARQDDFQGKIEGVATLIKKRGQSIIEGNFSSQGVDIYLPESLAPQITSLSVREYGIKPNTISDDEMAVLEREGNTLLNLHIELPNRVFVRGKGLESEWSGSLDIKGTLKSPTITGTLRIKMGIFQLLDQQFKLEDSVIQFTGASPPKPELDLRGVVNKESLIAILRVTGPIDQPSLRLESVPPLPEDQILAKLLFGREGENLTPIQALKIAALIRQLRGGGVDPMGRVRQAIGVDRLDITGDSVANGRLRVGKNVGDRLYVEVEQGVNVNSGQVNFELDVYPPFGLASTIRNDAGGYFGINWRNDY
ncbi:MAG: translocation/assembly module TamB domain-containing protein [Magnetococcales bacterium]|nr:translocation/assembly module TamB domain-containing protein [Magnetococcales bacterium]